MNDKLVAEWEQALADSGFVDCEHTKNGERVLKQFTTPDRLFRYQQQDSGVAHATAEYYRALEEGLRLDTKMPALDRHVMALHLLGRRIFTIVDDLTVAGFTLQRAAVRYLIRRYEQKWGIRQYTKKKLGRYR